MKLSDRVERVAEWVDDLPPTIRPAVFGALIVVFFAMARGAWIIIPIAVIYVFATSPHPWVPIMTGVNIGVLAMVGGGLSGLTYGLVGRHLRTAVRGGYYLAGLLTLAPYMFALSYVIRAAHGIPLWSRPTEPEVVMSTIMTVLFGLAWGVVSRA